MRNPEIRGSKIYETDDNPGDAFSRDRSFLEQTLKKSFPDAKLKSVTALWGDASTRRYFRIFTDSGSYIGQINDPFTDLNEAFPFLEVQKHLSLTGVAVPHIHSFDSKTGVIIQEDLGDLTLLKRLQNCSNPQQQLFLYKNVVKDLIDFHDKATSKKSNIEAFELAFDTEKLFWEMEFAIKYFFEEHLKIKPTSKERKILTDNFRNICEHLAAEPRVFTHRDFHSRNILLDKEDNFYIIDFQDSRMGLRQYDLCSLLRDSYFQMEEKSIYKLVNQYYESIEGEKSNESHFTKIFDLCTVQRNFKAIGTFCYIEKVRNNPQYLKYVGNTFENIKKILSKFPEYSDLKEVLLKYYYF